MKTIRRGIAFLLVAVLLLFAGCQTTPDPETTTAPEPETTVDNTQQELAALYDAAVEAVSGEALTMAVVNERTVTVAGHAFSEQSDMTVSYWNQGKEDFLAKVKGSVVFGDDAYELEVQEIFSDGKTYQTLDEGQFYAEMTAEDFADRYVPLKMLDSGLYTLSANDDKTVITFADATAGEAWIIPDDAQLNQASGSVTLDADGKLVKTEYTVEYQYGVATIHATYEVSLEKEGRKPVVPETADDYVLLSDIRAAYLQEHTYGYLSQAKHVSTKTDSMMASAAGAYSIMKANTTNVYAVDEEFAAHCESLLNITDYSSGESLRQEQIEKFIDGKYTTSLDGGREEPNASVDQKVMESAVMLQLLANIYDSDCIAQAEVTELDGAWLVEYTGTEEMGLQLCADLCKTFFGNGKALDDMASSYETKTLEYYVAVDQYSLLPTAVGIQYEGVHTIQGQEYPLLQQVDQSFDLASLTAYDVIFEEPAPEEEPEDPAQPLFYHVTGADGQEMWLLGTIHVGDERTGFLPDAIYDAFYKSDAFAIECNNDAFEKQVEEDEELQKMLAECYYYSDGTTAADHIETPELYEHALQWMKASGNYDSSTEQMKVYLWQSALDDFFMQQGYGLTREKGVENRLLALAEKEDIPVWEVESCEAQTKMTAGFSDHLQEVMLFSTMASGAKESWEATMELYELWCAGDEAAIKEKITIDTWELTEEDIDLEGLTGEDLERAQAILADLDNINAQLKIVAEEYDKAISVDRNEGMLEVAKEYLESGDTVFYAVGLAHLLAENGLITTLREAGYTVEQVTY